MTGEAMTWSVGSTPREPRGLPPIGQGLAVIAVVAAVMLLSLVGVATYVASLRIAAERAVVTRLDDAIAERRRQIVVLRREYDIRSRLSELDRWRQPLDLEAVRLGQLVERGDQVFAAARERRAALATETAPVDAPRSAGYPQAARRTLDDLVGEIAAN